MAESVLGKFITWALIILFIFIFLFIFYSPAEGFMGKIARLALGAERFLPVEPQKELKQDESLPQPVVTTQKNLIDDISRQSDSEKCLLELRDLSGLGDLRIVLSNYQGVTARVEKTSDVKLNSIKTSNENMEVCIINSATFWQCYFDPLKVDCSPQLYTKIDSAKITKDRITVNEKTYSLAQGFLFKPDKNKVCFIPIENDFGLTSNCDKLTTSLDSDCLSKFNRIPQCGAAELAGEQLCQIMYGCFDQLGVRRVSPAVYCNEKRAATKMYSQDDCEKVKQCSDKNLNMQGKCSQEQQTIPSYQFYILSYSS